MIARDGIPKHVVEQHHFTQSRVTDVSYRNLEERSVAGIAVIPVDAVFGCYRPQRNFHNNPGYPRKKRFLVGRSFDGSGAVRRGAGDCGGAEDKTGVNVVLRGGVGQRTIRNERLHACFVLCCVVVEAYMSRVAERKRIVQ